MAIQLMVCMFFLWTESHFNIINIFASSSDMEELRQLDRRKCIDLLYFMLLEVVESFLLLIDNSLN
jgi:hypothetical protein